MRVLLSLFFLLGLALAQPWPQGVWVAQPEEIVTYSGGEDPIQLIYSRTVSTGWAYAMEQTYTTLHPLGHQLFVNMSGSVGCSPQFDLEVTVDYCLQTGWPSPVFCQLGPRNYGGTFDYAVTKNRAGIPVIIVNNWGGTGWPYAMVCEGECSMEYHCNETVVFVDKFTINGGEQNISHSDVTIEGGTTTIEGDTVTVHGNVTLEAPNITDVTVNGEGELTVEMGDVTTLNIYANNLTSEGCGGVGYYTGYTSTNTSLTSDGGPHLLTLSAVPGFSLFSTDWIQFMNSFIYTGDDLTKYAFTFCINDPAFYYSNVNGSYIFQLLIEVDGFPASDSVYSVSYPFTLNSVGARHASLGTVCVQWTGLMNSTDDIDILYAIAGPTATVLLAPHFATFYAYPLDCAMRPIINNNSFSLNVSFNGTKMEIQPCFTKTFDPDTNTVTWVFNPSDCIKSSDDSIEWEQGPNNTYILKIKGLDGANGSITINASFVNATTVNASEVITSSICSPDGSPVTICSVATDTPTTEPSPVGGFSVCEVFPLGCGDDGSGHHHHHHHGGGGGGGGGGSGGGPPPIIFPPLLPPFYPPLVPIIPLGAGGGGFGAGLDPQGGVWIPIVNFTNGVPVCYEGTGSAAAVGRGSWMVVDNSTTPNIPYICLKQNATIWAWTPFSMGLPLTAVININGTDYHFIAIDGITIEVLPNNTLRWKLTDLVEPGYCINCVIYFNEKGQAYAFANGSYVWITPAFIVNTTMEFENATLALDANSQIVNLGPTFLGGPVYMNSSEIRGNCYNSGQLGVTCSSLISNTSVLPELHYCGSIDIVNGDVVPFTDGCQFSFTIEGSGFAGGVLKAYVKAVGISNSQWVATKFGQVVTDTQLLFGYAFGSPIGPDPAPGDTVVTLAWEVDIWNFVN